MGDPKGIHRDNVARFFRDHVPGGGVELTFELISGGRSNVTYLVRGGDREWVLRRPPLGHVLPTAHDMAREHRVLSALADSGVPVPRTCALCTDPSVNEQPFYVMEYRPGVVLADVIPPGFAETEADRRRLCEAFVDTLVRLHAIDWKAVGLEGFGHPEGFIERQVRRWSQQWERSKTGELPVIDELIRRLNAALPESPPPTIVHGDYRLGNMAFDPDDPGRVVAVFDWEMATLGDPLADVGYTLLWWGTPNRPPINPSQAVADLPGMPSAAEVCALYGADPDAIRFYVVLAAFKLTIIGAGNRARAKRLGAEVPTETPLPLAEWALELLSGAGSL